MISHREHKKKSMFFKTQPYIFKIYISRKEHGEHKEKTMLFKTPPTTQKNNYHTEIQKHIEIFYLNKKNKLNGVCLGLVHFVTLCEKKNAYLFG
jgi:hypothetical protein